jgi:hypothetical protein
MLLNVVWPMLATETKVLFHAGIIATDGRCDLIRQSSSVACTLR